MFFIEINLKVIKLIKLFKKIIKLIVIIFLNVLKYFLILVFVRLGLIFSIKIFFIIFFFFVD